MSSPATQVYGTVILRWLVGVMEERGDGDKERREERKITPPHPLAHAAT